ncbi:DUF475 domain-containing protein [Pseudoclavibacter sp. RFBA6]|uniref:DUF475 domain-containing protein n=1 Tax=Pseudoclavibacter sp. RFBA6 TaxID=2080573 RepID=UPI000CE7508E|nr:DUF475 domain-containing protein [Pseudoclavibacter sp. RFBA6]PPG41500.1 hypothetical protein C5C17_05635 [Pseudoclavibacter sp. RFBA6]
MRALRQIVIVPALLTAVAAVVAGVALGPQVALALVLLVTLEIAMAADSSVPMAGVASRIDSRARQLFLSLGLVIGVVSVRLLLPPLAVATDEGDAGGAMVEAVVEPSEFAADLLEVRPAIAAFGAVFVWLVFAEYLFNTDRLTRRPWMGAPEAALARVQHPWAWSWATAAAGALLVAALVAPADRPHVLAWSAAGGLTYALSKGVSKWARGGVGAFRLHAHASTVIVERALVIFLVFEILDGVSTLQSVTIVPVPAVQAMVAGTAVLIGAVFLAGLTSGVVSADGLSKLRHLRAGAAYVLGLLSVLLWTSLVVPIPGAVAAWAGSAVILAAFVTSLRPRARLRAKRVRLAGQRQNAEARSRAEMR